MKGRAIRDQGNAAVRGPVEIRMRHRQMRGHECEGFRLRGQRLRLAVEHHIRHGGHQLTLARQLFGKALVRIKPALLRHRFKTDGEGTLRPVIRRVTEHPLSSVQQWKTGLQSSIASSSSMMRSITDRPFFQKPGSPASRPKGASNSEWCLVPPAFSRSKYFCWNPASASS